MKGTLLNTATVVAGSLAGLLVRSALPKSFEPVAFGALGLVTVGMGLKMFLASRSIPLLAASLVLGGLLGALLGLAPGIEALAEWLKGRVGGSGTFTLGFVTASVLFVVGPMTVLGCVEDGLTGRSETLRLKSTLDGFASLFLASSLGVGVLFSAMAVLVVQGGLTLAAKPLAPLRERPEALAELEGVGGAILVGVGLGLLGVKRLPLADYLPALALAPLAAMILKNREARRA